jgi:hypothetical protein
LLVGPAPVRAQSSAEIKARQHRAEVERRIRESKARIEAAKRKAGLSPEPTWRGAPPAVRAPAFSAEDKAWFAEQNKKAAAREAAKPKYKFDGGREFAYRFVLSLTDSEGTRYITGHAAFTLSGRSGGSPQLLARDNLQEVDSLDAFQPQATGELTSMLPRTIHVHEQGDEPDVDKNLPALMGNLEEWFFPPFPQSETDEPSGGQTVIRESDGRWDTSGFYNKLDRSAKGYYEWSVKPRGFSGGVVTATDKRSLRSDDGSIELVGQGGYTISLARGILLSRTFRATHKEGGNVTQVSLEITPATPSALDQ